MSKRWIAGIAGAALGLLLTSQIWACDSMEDASVSKVDTIKQQVVVTKGDTKETFTMTADKTLITINGKPAVLADLKVGDTVSVAFETDTDVVAVSVTRAG